MLTVSVSRNKTGAVLYAKFLKAIKILKLHKLRKIFKIQELMFSVNFWVMLHIFKNYFSIHIWQIKKLIFHLSHWDHQRRTFLPFMIWVNKKLFRTYALRLFRALSLSFNALRKNVLIIKNQCLMNVSAYRHRIAFLHKLEYECKKLKWE